MSAFVRSEGCPHPCVWGECEESLAPGGASSGHLLLLAVVRRATSSLIVQTNNLRWRKVRERPCQGSKGVHGSQTRCARWGTASSLSKRASRLGQKIHRGRATPSGLWGWHLAPGSYRLVLGNSGFLPLSLGVGLRLPLGSRRPGGLWSHHSYGHHFDVHSGLTDWGKHGAWHHQ
jgi:hypothetical protein